MKRVTINRCPLCDGTQLQPVMNCTDRYASGEQFTVCACADCGFTFTQEAPAGAEMDRYYETPDYISHSNTKKGAMNFIYHWVRSYMLRRKAHLVMKEAHRKKGTLLDIGTGTGYFANAMQKRGWQVDAVEKHAAARAFAREQFALEVKSPEALDSFASESFDVITLWHVLEHLESLEESWKLLHRLLRERGVVVVAVPNRASYDATHYGADWAAYDVPRHLWHFTSTTMQQLASKHGFVLAAHHPMPFDGFYLSMLSERQLGRSCSFLRGLRVGTLAWLYSFVKKEQSSSMIYVFRKKR